MLRKGFVSKSIKGLTTLSLLAFTNVVLAADERILASQGEYIGDSLPLWKEVLLIVCFIAGVAAILFGGWQLLKKYVLAKSDHEKSFSAPEMIVAMIVGGIIAFPSGGMLIGQDLTVGTGTVQEVDASDFDVED